MLNTALKDFTDRQPHRAISDTEFRDIAASLYNDFFVWVAESVLDPVPRLWAEVTGPSALGQFDQMIDEIEALQDGPRTKEHLTYIEHKMRQAQKFWGEIVADCPVRKQVTVKNRRIFHLGRPVDSGVLTRFRSKLADVLDGADIEFVFPQNPEKAQPSRNQGKISSLFPEDEESETHKPPKSMLTESKEETVASKSPWSEWLDQGEIEIVTDLDGFRAVVNEASKVGICGLDLETTGLDPLTAKIRLVQMGIPKYPGSKRLVDEAGKSPVSGGSAKAYVIDLFALSADERKEIVEILVALVGDPNVIKIGHNLSFDLGFIRASAGRRIPMRNLFDTMLASQLVWAGFFKMEPTTSKNSKYKFKEVYPRHRLSDCVDRHLNTKLDKTGQTSDWSAETLTHDQILYAGKDVLILPVLYEVLLDLIQRNEMEEAARLEFDCLPPVVEMEITGMPLNLTATRGLLNSLTKERDELETKLIGMAESSGCEFKTIRDVRKGVPGRFNPASIPNVLEYFKHRGHSVSDTRDETLQDLARAGDEFARLLLGFREKTKRVAFLVSWLEKTGDDPNGYAHLRSSYRQLGDKGVGRFTSSDVNLQQIPRTKEYRELFEVPEGRCLVIADYSAIELRIMAWLSGDPTMVTAFQNHQDLHRLTAAAVGRKDVDKISKEERQAAKACYSGDTEILTLDGWVRFDAYDGRTPVAQYLLPDGVTYNPPRSSGNRWTGPKEKRKLGVGQIEYVPPLDFRSFDKEELVHFTDRNVDLLVTPNHEIVWIDNNGRPRKERADSLTAGNLYHFIASGVHDKDDYTLSEIETRILAMAVADGSFKSQPGNLCFGFSKPNKINRCRSLLVEYGLVFCEAEYSNGKNGTAIHFIIKDQTFVNKLLRYVTIDKDLEIQAAHEVNPLWYLDEAKYWDSFVIDGKNRKRVRFSTTRKQTADLMQMMCAVTGIPSVMYVTEDSRPNRSAIYLLSYCFHKNRAHPVVRFGGKTKGNIFTPVSGQHTVYCVQVPSGAIVVRRNGKVVVCGNCNFGLIYGCGAQRLADSAKYDYGVDMPLSEANRAKKAFFATYPKIEEWHQKQRSLMDSPVPHWFHHHNTGYYSAKLVSVTIPPGRKRVWPWFKGKTLARLTMLANSPDQGTGASILKRALIRVHDRLLEYGWDDVYLAANVHDEIILEGPMEKAETMKEMLEKEMVHAGAEFIDPVPVEVEGNIGTSWAEK